MKKITSSLFSLLVVASMLVSLTGFAAAAGASKDENKLKAEILMLNTHAKLPQADQVMKKELTDNFNVKNDKISSLLGKNLKYGDIAAVLAFADKMEGGVNDANINKVANMVQSKTGWSKIASSLNVDIADVSGKLADLEDSTHKSIKQALAEGTAAGRGAGGSEDRSEDLSGGATGGTGTESDSGGMTGEGAGGSDDSMSGGSAGGTDSGTTGGSGGGGY